MATKEELQPLIAPAGSGTTTTYSDPFSSEPQSPSLTGETISVQQAHDPYDSDHTKTAMVVSMDSVASSMRQRATGAPEHSRPVSYGPDFLNVRNTSSASPSINRAQEPARLEEVPPPSTPTTGVPEQCSEQDQGHVAFSPNPSLSSDAAHNARLLHENTPPSCMDRFIYGLRTNPRAVCVFAVVTIFCLSVLLAAVAVPSIISSTCSVYNEQADVYSGDTVLLQTNINRFCHSTLHATEVASKQGDYIRQEVDLYTGPCADVKTYSQSIQFQFNNFLNFTGAFPVMENEYLTVDSNLSFVINVSTANQREIIYVCLFNDIDYYKEFTTSEHWKDYIQYAVKCTESPISTSTFTLFNIFRHNITKTDYYFVGFAVEGTLANLDLMKLHGVRYLYNTSVFKQVNCTLTSEIDSCQLPLINGGEFPCVFAHGQPFQSSGKPGYSGVLVTSDVAYTTDRTISIVVPVVIGTVILVLFVIMLVVCVVKLSRVHVYVGVGPD